jgi:hypothetical protein
MNPVQDLHGQSAPYPAGCGKNLFKAPTESSTSNQVTLTPIDENTFTLSGNASTVASMWYIPLPYDIPANTNVTFSINNDVVNDEVGIRLLNTVDGGSGTSYGTSVFADSVNKTGTVSQNWVAKSINIFVKTGHTSVPTITLKIQVEIGTTATNFAPYENICPISGWTELNVARYGINLATTEIYKQGYVLGSDGSESASSNYCITKKIFIEAGKKYILRFKENSGELSDNAIRIGFYKADGTFISRSIITNGRPAITIGNDVAFLCFSYVNVSTSANYKWDIMFNEGETPLDYVPYQGTTHTATLGSTYYGGKLDMVSGKLTIDRAYFEYDGSNDENWDKTTSSGNPIVRTPKPSGIKSDDTAYTACNMLTRTTSSTQIYVGKFYIGGSNIVIGYDDTLENWKSFIGTTHLQFVFELETPTEITLTAEQIELLKGNNVVSSDADDLELTYSVG